MKNEKHSALCPFVCLLLGFQRICQTTTKIYCAAVVFYPRMIDAKRNTKNQEGSGNLKRMSVFATGKRDWASNDKQESEKKLK